MRSLISLMMLIIFFACSKDDEPRGLSRAQIEQMNRETIEKYLSDNNLNAQVTASGLHYIIDELGAGGHPTIDSEVTVHYRGYFTDNVTFDSSIDRNEPITIPLRNVIQGWQEGIPLFQKGGKGLLLIPSTLGYGSFPPAGIPANAVLLFDIELIDFN